MSVWRFRWWLTVLAVAMICGCANVPKNDTVAKASSSLAPAWRTSGTDSDQGLELTAWWAEVSDPQLRALISKALERNYDLRAAIERSRQAQSLVTVARSPLFPELDVNASGIRARAHLPPPVGWLSDSGIGVNGSWAIDVFGGNQLALLATVARAAATEESRRDFEVALSASVATTYAQLRGSQRQWVILEDNIAARADTLKLTQVRYEAGLATDLDVARAETQLRQLEASVPEVQRQIDNDLGALAILTGEIPESIDGALSQPTPILAISPVLPRQAPAQLLERRPDLRAAARRIDAATATLGSAKADLLPKFTLFFGTSTDRLDYHGAPAVTDTLFNLGLGVFWPLFNAGRIHANIAAQDATLRQAEYGFDQALLNALQDVESAYTDTRAQRESSVRLSLAVDAAQRSSRLAQDLYEAGEADFLSVLDAHTEVFDTERDMVQAQTNAAVSAVSLYRALGGGWRQDASPSASTAGPQ